MNYLKYPLSKVKIDYIQREYNYTFLDELNDVYDINLIYSYLLSIEEYKLKNIWNLFVRKWINMSQSLQDNTTFKRSKYSKDSVNFIHNNITDTIFDQLLCDFIKKDTCRSIFIVNAILLSF